MSMYECNYCGEEFGDFPKAFVLILEDCDGREFEEIKEDEINKQGVNHEYNLNIQIVWDRFYAYLGGKHSNWLCEDCYNKLIKEPVEKIREEARIYWENYYKELGEK